MTMKMYNTIDLGFDVKASRIVVKQPKKRTCFPALRATYFGDKRRKRTRTRQAELAKAIKEMD